MRRVLSTIAVIAAAVFGLTRLSGTFGAAPPPSAKALEARILAPCCFGGTLDTHDSEIARQLRSEIEARVAAGERIHDIEADLVVRYGEAIRALPNPGAWFATAVGVIAACLVGAFVLLRGMRRWVAASSPASLRSQASDDAYDERLNAELDALE